MSLAKQIIATHTVSRTAFDDAVRPHTPRSQRVAHEAELLERGIDPAALGDGEPRGHRSSTADVPRSGGEVHDLMNGRSLGQVMDDIEDQVTHEIKWPSISYDELAAQYPRLNDPVIDGLARVAETLNIISVSKVGKSWLVYNLLLSTVTGRTWLDRFPTARGRVLLIDNELHKPTLAYRIREVAETMGIQPQEYGDQIDIWPIRGAGLDIFTLGRSLDQIEPGTYKLVVVDAKYRAIAQDASENDNAAETRFYNECDRIAEHLQAVLGLVHHSSKGSQSDKRVTDVGSGAGAQSRAADAHLVLREHEESGCVVLDAAVRSFKPIEPIGLRWEFPLWVPDDGIDTTALKGRQSAGEEKQGKLDAEADAAILECCQTWKSRKEIRTATGYGDGRRDKAIARLVKQKLLDVDTQDRPRHPETEVFRKSIHAN